MYPPPPTPVTPDTMGMVDMEEPGIVPFILLGGSDDWPEWLHPVSYGRWIHILYEHGPNSTGEKPRFVQSTDIAKAIFDTVTQGRLIYDSDDGKIWNLFVNGQLVEVVARDIEEGFFIVTAYPRE